MKSENSGMWRYIDPFCLNKAPFDAVVVETSMVRNGRFFSEGNCLSLLDEAKSKSSAKRNVQAHTKYRRQREIEGRHFTLSQFTAIGDLSRENVARKLQKARNRQ